MKGEAPKAGGTATMEGHRKGDNSHGDGNPGAGDHSISSGRRDDSGNIRWAPSRGDALSQYCGGEATEFSTRGKKREELQKLPQLNRLSQATLDAVFARITVGDGFEFASSSRTSHMAVPKEGNPRDDDSDRDGSDSTSDTSYSDSSDTSNCSSSLLSGSETESSNSNETDSWSNEPERKDFAAGATRRMRNTPSELFQRQQYFGNPICPRYHGWCNVRDQTASRPVPPAPVYRATMVAAPQSESMSFDWESEGFRDAVSCHLSDDSSRSSDRSSNADYGDAASRSYSDTGLTSSDSSSSKPPRRSPLPRGDFTIQSTVPFSVTATESAYTIQMKPSSGGVEARRGVPYTVNISVPPAFGSTQGVARMGTIKESTSATYDNDSSSTSNDSADDSSLSSSASGSSTSSCKSDTASSHSSSSASSSSNSFVLGELEMARCNARPPSHALKPYKGKEKEKKIMSFEHSERHNTAIAALLAAANCTESSPGLAETVCGSSSSSSAWTMSSSDSCNSSDNDNRDSSTPDSFLGSEGSISEISWSSPQNLYVSHFVPPPPAWTGPFQYVAPAVGPMTTVGGSGTTVDDVAAAVQGPMLVANCGYYVAPSPYFVAASSPMLPNIVVAPGEASDEGAASESGTSSSASCLDRKFSSDSLSSSAASASSSTDDNETCSSCGSSHSGYSSSDYSEEEMEPHSSQHRCEQHGEFITQSWSPVLSRKRSLRNLRNVAKSTSSLNARRDQQKQFQPFFRNLWFWRRSYNKGQ